MSQNLKPNAKRHGTFEIAMGQKHATQVVLEPELDRKDLVMRIVGHTFNKL